MRYQVCHHTLHVHSAFNLRPFKLACLPLGNMLPKYVKLSDSGIGTVVEVGITVSNSLSLPGEERSGNGEQDSGLGGDHGMFVIINSCYLY